MESSVSKLTQIKINSHLLKLIIVINSLVRQNENESISKASPNLCKIKFCQCSGGTQAKYAQWKSTVEQSIKHIIFFSSGIVPDSSKVLSHFGVLLQGPSRVVLRYCCVGLIETRMLNLFERSQQPYPRRPLRQRIKNMPHRTSHTLFTTRTHITKMPTGPVTLCKFYSMKKQRIKENIGSSLR